jgi:hypothetical protein
MRELCQQRDVPGCQALVLQVRGARMRAHEPAWARMCLHGHACACMDACRWGGRRARPAMVSWHLLSCTLSRRGPRGGLPLRSRSLHCSTPATQPLFKPSPSSTRPPFSPRPLPSDAGAIHTPQAAAGCIPEYGGAAEAVGGGRVVRRPA